MLAASMPVEESQSWICSLGQMMVYALPCARWLNVSLEPHPVQCACTSSAQLDTHSVTSSYCWSFSNSNATCHCAFDEMQCKLASTCLAMRAAKESAQQQLCQTLPLPLTGSCNTACLLMFNLNARCCRRCLCLIISVAAQCRLSCILPLCTSSSVQSRATPYLCTAVSRSCQHPKGVMYRLCRST